MNDFDKRRDIEKILENAEGDSKPKYDEADTLPSSVPYVVPESLLSSRRHPLSQRFHEILGELGELHDLKQQDYGTDEDPFANVRSAEAFGIPGWVGAALRGNDKMKRIQAFALKGALANESLEDSLRDLAVYAVIGLVLLEEEKGE